MEGCCLLACSACCVIERRTTSPGMAPPTMGWALPYQSLIKEIPYRLAYSPILWRHFLNWGFLLSDDFSLCQLDIKMSQHVSLIVMFTATLPGDLQFLDHNRCYHPGKLYFFLHAFYLLKIRILTNRLLRNKIHHL